MAMNTIIYMCSTFTFIQYVICINSGICHKDSQNFIKKLYFVKRKFQHFIITTSVRYKNYTILLLFHILFTVTLFYGFIRF